VNRGPVGVRGVSRSRRNVRQSARSTSQASRYQRHPAALWCSQRSASPRWLQQVRRLSLNGLLRQYFPKGTDLSNNPCDAIRPNSSTKSDAELDEAEPSSGHTPSGFASAPVRKFVGSPRHISLLWNRSLNQTAHRAPPHHRVVHGPNPSPARRPQAHVAVTMTGDSWRTYRCRRENTPKRAGRDPAPNAPTAENGPEQGRPALRQVLPCESKGQAVR
jgi:hypothetical protein